MKDVKEAVYGMGVGLSAGLWFAIMIAVASDSDLSGFWVILISIGTGIMSWFGVGLAIGLLILGLAL